LDKTQGGAELARRAAKNAFTLRLHPAARSAILGCMQEQSIASEQESRAQAEGDEPVERTDLRELLALQDLQPPKK